MGGQAVSLRLIDTSRNLQDAMKSIWLASKGLYTKSHIAVVFARVIRPKIQKLTEIT